MRKLFATGWSLFVMAVLAGTCMAQAAPGVHYKEAAYQMGGMPYGTYQQTCRDVRMRGNRLEARCQKKDGGLRDTSIEYRSCRGQIVNDDGNLRCDNRGGGRDYDRDYDRSGWQGGLPRGNYRQTCQNIRMNGDRVEARCQKRDGGWRDSAMDYRACRGEIINDDGNLRCAPGGGYAGGRDRDWDRDRDHDRDRDRDYDRGRWQGRMPPGNYQQTCQNVNMNGGLLQARCQRKDGGWRDTSLDYRSCPGADVYNEDGNLRCGSNRGGWQGGGPGGFWRGGVPQGSYQQTCQNVGVSGNRLQARCQKKEGGWRDTSIDYRSCRGEIVNDDGNLRCK